MTDGRRFAWDLVLTEGGDSKVRTSAMEIAPY